MGILPVFFIFMILPLFLLAINPNNSPSGKINKDVRARYPSLVLMRESLMPNPTARPQKNTRHVLDMPKERAKLRNPVMELSSTKLRRRKPISARYKSIFGHSKPMRGSEFTPSNIVHYTGKLAQSRRQTFKWSPSGRTEDYFLIPRH